MLLSPAMQAVLDQLPSAMDVEASRKGKPLPKGKSRLEAKAEAAPLTKVTDAQFKKTVRDRDRMRCRRCGRKVKVCTERDPLRAEVHHIHGRLGNLRHEDRCAILTCASCHEKVTGKVNERWIVVGTKFLAIDGVERVDARAPVRFERIV
jgi:hypothetical protein